SGRSLASMVAEGGDLTELPGIGANVAAHIVELLETGRIRRLDEVAAELPLSLVELVALEGLGPKKVRKLFDALYVRTLEDLEEALEGGRVERLDGFGKRSAAKIRDSIEDRRSNTGPFRIAEAEGLVAGILAHMEGVPG